MRGLRDRLYQGLARRVAGLGLNGDAERRLPGNLNLSFPGISAPALIEACPTIAISTGSACTSATVEPSYVLRALGLPDALANSAIRIGLGRFTTAAEVDFAVDALAAAAARLAGREWGAGSAPEHPHKRRMHALEKRMRARQQALTVTDAAAERIQALLAKRGKPSAGIRIGVRSRGCSGLSYTLEYADEKGKFDEVVEDKGVTVLIDPKAVMFILGTEMDYVEEKLQNGFTFRNPNEKGRCGCGESFHV